MKRTAAWLVAGALALASASSSATRPSIEQTLLFDNLASPFQTNWLGVAANYELFAAFPEFGLTTEQKTAEWDRVQRSGVKIVRTFYDVAWAFGNTYPGGTADWTSANMLAFYEGVAAMKARGIKVVVNTGWSFTGGICGPFAGVASVVTPTPTMEAAWAAWMSETFNQLINVRGYTNVIGAVLFTEPNLGAAAEPIPGGYTGQSYYVHMIDVLDTKIRSDDGGRTPIRPLLTLLAGQEQTTGAATWMQYVAANDTKADALSAHSYVASPTYAPYGLGGSNDLTHAQLITRFAGYVSDASPRPFWVDEGNTTVGGNSDSTGYRSTADAGVQMIKWHDAHMQAGVQADFPWTLQDERYWPAPADPVTQEFGVAKSIHDSTDVRASWYAFSAHANLTGGGGGTKLYRSVNGTSTLHGTGVWIPQGVRNATNAVGEYTFVAINEAALPLRTQVRFKSPIPGRTIYRYVYSAEWPPDAAADPAYLLPWDQRYTGVTKNIPPNVIPGRSVVIYSTINLSTPAAQNLALTAVATSDSTDPSASPDNANDGNRSNVQGMWNGWRKGDDNAHYVELDWATSVTIGRVDLSLVGTTAGVVYATYINTTSPPPLAVYTVQTWNGSSWVEQVNVSGNSAPNRSHSFTPVSTTKLRVNALGAAVAAQINEVGAYAQ